MPTRKKKTDTAPLTTAQSLSSLLKSARDIMRKDKGLNGDLDRLPLLTWVMFLKFMDDLERQQEDEAVLAGTRFRPAIEAPYRWRDWAAAKTGLTGDDLLAFVNNERASRPDGNKGAGLFAYLRKLTASNGDKRRDVIATVFRGIDNRMKSGYLLRDVVDKVDAIHFTASDELHTLGALYENLLREMRDAAGDAGEFYTPRTLVRLMVRLLDPRLGETVLDPASGTGGFLVEAYAHLAGQVHTVAERKTLQRGSIHGCEPKSLPYLLCQMNLLLHGLDAPDIDPGNALRHKLTDIGLRERVDVILSNPPFGGEEEKGIQGNFPDDKQTSETALLFLQLIMRRLHRRPSSAGRPARAAVVVPNGTLFGDGVCARIKAELLRDFNLHTILRLPNGVFAPYTSIPTNVLFFDRSGPTQDVWYWEHKLPEGRKNYTKTQPLQFDEFASLMAWWDNRQEGEQAWKVPAAELLAANCNLDRKNPRGGRHHAPGAGRAGGEHPGEGGGDRADRRADSGVASRGCNVTLCPSVPLGELLTQDRDYVSAPEPREYKKLSVRLFGKGVALSAPVRGDSVKMQRHQLAKAGQVILSEIWGKKGAIGLVPPEGEGALCTSHFFLFDIDDTRLDTRWMRAIVTRNYLGEALDGLARGTTGYASVRPGDFLSVSIPLPPLPEQQRIMARVVEATEQLDRALGLQARVGAEADELCRALLRDTDAVATPLRQLVRLRDPDVRVRADHSYQFAGVYSFGRGVFVGNTKSGTEFAYPKLTRLRTGDFVYPKLMAWEGAFGVVPRECDGLVVSTEFPVFEINRERVLPEVLDMHFRSPAVWASIGGASTGTNVRRRRLNPQDFLDLELPLPSMERQRVLAKAHEDVQAVKARQSESRAMMQALLPAILDRAFAGAL